MARTDWQTITGSTNNNNSFFTGIRWRYRDDLFGTSGYPSDRTTSNTDIIEYQPYVGKKNSSTTSRYYVNWLTSYYKYSYNTTSGSEPGSADNQLNISTTYRFDKATANTSYYLTKGSLSSGNPMNTSSDNTTRIIQVPHCSDGTSKLRLYFYFKGDSGTSFTYAETNQVVTLETIPRASTITVNDANIGSATNIVINKASSNFTTTLYYKASGQGSFTKIVDKTANQVYGWTVPTSFYSLIPNSKTIQCQFYAETYSGSTLVGTSATVTATFTATGNPVINSFTLVDTNSTTTALTGDSSKMIRYASNVKATISASGQNSASVSSIKVNGTTASGGIVNFNAASTNSFQVVVTDSRGYTTSQTKTMTMVDYIPLTLNATIKRNTPVDGKINVSFNGNYFNSSFGSQSNTLTIQYRSRIKDGTWGSWTTISATTSGNTYSGSTQLSGYTYTNQYEFQIKAVDKVQTKAIEGISIAKGQPIFNWRDGYFNVNGDYYRNGSLLSDLFLSKSGGTISGNLNVTGNLQKNGSNVALASAIPTKTSQLTNDSFLTETVLYNDSTGTTGTVTLSSSAANFTYLEIYGYDNDDDYFYQKLYSPDGKKINITTAKSNGTYIYHKVQRLTISGTSITRSNLAQIRVGNNVATSYGINTANVQFYITRVVGIK